MPYLNPRVYDNGLTVLDTEANVFHICSSEPSTFAGVAGVSLGNATTLSIGAPADRSGGGREVTVAAITTGGNVTANGTATHYAIVDTVNSRLLAANSLSASQVVTSGNTFTTGAFTIGIPGPV